MPLIDDYNKSYFTPSDIEESKSKLAKQLSNKEIITNLCKESHSIKLKEIEARKLNDNDLRNMCRLKLKKIEKQIIQIYHKEYKEKLSIKEIYRKFS